MENRIENRSSIDFKLNISPANHIIATLNSMRILESALVIVLGVFALSWVGIWNDPEFGEHAIFLKHRPAIQLEFYSPTGMSDMQLADLPPERYEDEEAYINFVSSRWKMVEATHYPALALHGLGLTAIMLGFLGLFGRLGEGSIGRKFLVLVLGQGLSIATYVGLVNETYSVPIWALLSIGLSLLFPILISVISSLRGSAD